MIVKVEGTNQQNNELPSSEIYNFSYEYTRKAETIWILLSKKALVFDEKDLIKIEKVNLTFYKKKKIDSIVTSRYGEIQRQDKILTAITNVVLRTADGTVLYTEILNWNDNTQKLYTDEFVEIHKPNGDIIKGVGMIADNNLERMTITKNVSGQFYEKN